MKRIDSPVLFWGIGLVLLVPIVLAEIYRFVGLFIIEPWVAAASVNTVVGIAVWAYLRPQILADHDSKWQSFVPAIAVVVLSVIAAGLSRMLGGAQSNLGLSIHQFGWILWVPIVEELVFRVGLGSLLISRLGQIWGGYCSAVLFAFVHSLPTVSRVMSLEIGLAVGPFILGLVCQFLWQRYRSLGAIIALHAACNGTVVIFMVGDVRWLNWLRWFYL